MAFFGVTKQFLKNGMTNLEKIAAAKKRIKELELLIDLWFKDYANWKDAK